MKNLYSITYISHSNTKMDAENVRSLLEKARNHNTKNDITGILMMLDYKFIQILEGSQKSVKDLYQKIKQDSRHKDLLVLLEMEVETRVFEDWSMGFIEIEGNQFSEVSGFTNVDAFVKGLSSQNTWNPSLEFLKKFYFSNRLFVQ